MSRTPLAEISDEEDAEIQRGIDQDPDNPELTEEDIRRGLLVRVRMPESIAAGRRSRGPQLAPTKVHVSLRLDAGLVAALRASGKGWQSRVNAILKKEVLGG